MDVHHHKPSLLFEYSIDFPYIGCKVLQIAVVEVRNRQVKTGILQKTEILDIS